MPRLANVVKPGVSRGELKKKKNDLTQLMWHRLHTHSTIGDQITLLSSVWEEQSSSNPINPTQRVSIQDARGAYLETSSMQAAVQAKVQLIISVYSIYDTCKGLF